MSRLGARIGSKLGVFVGSKLGAFTGGSPGGGIAILGAVGTVGPGSGQLASSWMIGADEVPQDGQFDVDLSQYAIPQISVFGEFANQTGYIASTTVPRTCCINKDGSAAFSIGNQVARVNADRSLLWLSDYYLFGSSRPLGAFTHLANFAQANAVTGSMPYTQVRTDAGTIVLNQVQAYFNFLENGQYDGLADTALMSASTNSALDQSLVNPNASEWARAIATRHSAGATVQRGVYLKVMGANAAQEDFATDWIQVVSQASGGQSIVRDALVDMASRRVWLIAVGGATNLLDAGAGVNPIMEYTFDINPSPATLSYSRSINGSSQAQAGAFYRDGEGNEFLYLIQPSAVDKLNLATNTVVATYSEPLSINHTGSIGGQSGITSIAVDSTGRVYITVNNDSEDFGTNQSRYTTARVKCLANDLGSTHWSARVSLTPPPGPPGRTVTPAMASVAVSI